MEELLTTLLSDKSQEFFLVGILAVVVLAITLLLVIPLSKIRSLKHQLLDIKDLISKRDDEITRLQREKKAIKTKNSILEEKLILFDELNLKLDSSKTQISKMQESTMLLESINQEHIHKYQTLDKDHKDLGFKFKSIQKRNEVLVEENSQFRTENKKTLSKVKEQEDRIFDAIRTNSTIDKRREMEELASEFFDTNRHIYETISSKISCVDLLPTIDKVAASQEELLYLYEGREHNTSDIISNIKHYQKIDQDVDIIYDRLHEKGRLQELGNSVVEYILKLSCTDQEHIIKDENSRSYNILLKDEKHIKLDANLSLESYQNYLDIEHRIEKDNALSNYIKIFENHLESLADGLEDSSFCLILSPTKEALELLLKHRSHLYNESYKKRVLLVTPTALLAGLQDIASLWEHQEQYERANSFKIISEEFYEMFSTYNKDIDSLSQELEQIQDTLAPVTSSDKESIK